MKASVEISMYPLDKEYGSPILRFIERLRQHEGLMVNKNTMSTQIFGDYDKIMAALSSSIKATFEEGTDTMMVMKIANLDLRP